MRRAVSVTAVALVATLVLSGCGSSDAQDPAPSATPSTTAGTGAEVGSDGPFPTATGAFGDKPELTFPSGVPASSLQVAVLSPGDGKTVEAGDVVAVNMLGQVWGGNVLDSSYDRGQAMTFALGAGKVIPGWDAGLVGQTVGSRVMLSVPPDLAYGEEGYKDGGIPGSVTLVFVFDILGAYAPDAGGDVDATPTADASGVVPVVKGELGSTASVTVPEGAPEPTGSSVTVLAEGTGDPVHPGQVVVQYSWVTWDNAQAESTWVTGSPAVLKTGNGGPFDGLVGVPVGSRVLVVAPATESAPAAAMVVDLVDQISTSD